MKEEFVRHLAEAPYKKGVINNRWRLVRFDEPQAFFELATSNGQIPWIGLHLDLTGYPTAAPLGEFWNFDTSQRLEAKRWPTLNGNSALRSDRKGLYIACDRDALATYPDWAQTFPNTNWRPDIGVARYLSVVYGLLQDASLPN